MEGGGGWAGTVSAAPTDATKLARARRPVGETKRTPDERFLVVGRTKSTSVVRTPILRIGAT